MIKCAWQCLKADTYQSAGEAVTQTFKDATYISFPAAEEGCLLQLGVRSLLPRQDAVLCAPIKGPLSNPLLPCKVTSTKPINLEESENTNVTLGRVFAIGCLDHIQVFYHEI